MGTKTYDPGDVLVVFGAIPISGFADGEMVKVTHQGDGVKVAVGSAGEVAFIESHQKAAEVTIRLMSTAFINSLLTAHYQAGNLAVPLVITDASTGSTHVSGAAKIKRMPDAAYGSEIPVREWAFMVAKLEDVLLAPP